MHQLYRLLLLGGCWLLITTGLHAQYGGGTGDGHASGFGTQQLFGFDESSIYGGGGGDGYASGFGNQQFFGFDESSIYGGGGGDGYASGSGSQQFFGFEITGIYGGGDGDGYANGFGSRELTALPLALVTFEAYPHEKYVLLKWVTEAETDTDFFTIERTTDGSSFATVGTTLAAGQSEPGEQLHYELTDTDPRPGTSYYRLRTTDFDGSFSLSALEEVRYTADAATEWNYVLFPNPNDGTRLHLETRGQINGGTLAVELFDAAGRSVLRQQLTDRGSATHTLDLSGRLAAGSYLVRATARGEAISKLIIVR